MGRATTQKASVITKAVELLGQGHTQQDVAIAVGRSRQTINALAQNYRKEIEDRTLAMLTDTLPLVCANQLQTIYLANIILQAVKSVTGEALNVKANLDILGIGPSEILALADKKEQRIMQIAGMAPSHTQSVVINQILQANMQGSTLAADTDALRSWLDLKRQRDLEAGEQETDNSLIVQDNEK